MDEIKDVKNLFRAEMLGAGLYGELSRQVMFDQPKLSARLREAAEQEHMHGRLFGQFHKNLTGSRPRGEKLFRTAGFLAANMLHPIPIRRKLQVLSIIEGRAARQLEAEIERQPGYYKILKRILPDEQAHAGLYHELYNA